MSVASGPVHLQEVSERHVPKQGDLDLAVDFVELPSADGLAFGERVFGRVQTLDASEVVLGVDLVVAMLVARREADHAAIRVLEQVAGPGGATPTKPGSCTQPLPGIFVEVVDEAGTPIQGNNVGGYLVITKPWPSMLRTIWGDDQRYIDTYWKTYGDLGYYFAGDGAKKDEDGDIWLLGRVDDVINVSGHRLSTTEIESALVSHPKVAEAAVVGAADEMTGQAVCAFVILRESAADDSGTASDDLIQELRKHVAHHYADAVADQRLLLARLIQPRMPRFYFNIKAHDTYLPDDEGEDCPTLQVAGNRALAGATVLPNGVDFWWDEFAGNNGNCWVGNTGPDGTPASVTTLTLSERWFTTQTSSLLRAATATGSRPTGMRAARLRLPVAPMLKTSSVWFGVLTAKRNLPLAMAASVAWLWRSSMLMLKRPPAAVTSTTRKTPMAAVATTKATLLKIQAMMARLK